MCLSRAYIVHLQGGKPKILFRNFTHESHATNVVKMNSNNQNILLLFRMPRVVDRYELVQSICTTLVQSICASIFQII